MSTMDENAKAPPLSRELRTAEIEEDTALRIEATPAERADVVALLDLVALDGLTLDYRLHRGTGGRIELTGRLKAKVTQTCVVSLEPVESSVDVPVEIEFWPTPLVDELEHKAEDPGQSGLIDWPETIVDGLIDLGPVVYETFATALDPYPKRAGASFQWSEGAEGSEADETGPFAALKRLKDG